MTRSKEAVEMVYATVTVKRWIYSGRIRAVKNPAGRWLIPESEVNRLLGIKVEKPKRAIIYARVSSHEQKEHLERQAERLRKFAKKIGLPVKKKSVTIDDLDRAIPKVIRAVEERDYVQVETSLIPYFP